MKKDKYKSSTTNGLGVDFAETPSPEKIAANIIAENNRKLNPNLSLNSKDILIREWLEEQKVEIKTEDNKVASELIIPARLRKSQAQQQKDNKLNLDPESLPIGIVCKVSPKSDHADFLKPGDKIFYREFGIDCVIHNNTEYFRINDNDFVCKIELS